MNKNILNNLENNIVFLDDNGKASTDIVSLKGANYLSYSQIPDKLKKAFIAIEDKRFFKHHGIDYVRTTGAMLNNLKKGKIVEGGSTITQQLVKNTHLSSDKTFKRKIQEIRIAKEIERNYSKEEILEMYLNMLYFGNNIYGVSNAAAGYFDCEVNKLSLAQCAALAAIINNPSAYNPYTNKAQLIQRKNIVLKRMKKLKYISEKEFADAINEDLNIRIKPEVYNHCYEFAYKEAKELLGKNELDDSLQIETTINSKYQKITEEILSESIPNEKIMAQAVLIENSSGKVLAYAGSDNFDYTDFRRQLGSTVKPFICYAACLEKNLIYPCTPILDEPITFENNFAPKNYKDNYMGWISVQDALIHSSNVCAVKLLDMAGINYAKNFASKTGLEFQRDDNSLLLALGSTHNGNRLIEIANAYQMLGNGGVYIPCCFINELRNSEGVVLYRNHPEKQKIMDSGNAFLVNSMLTQCVQKGTAKKLKSCDFAIAAKTGTVGSKNGNTDAYCITYGENYTLAVWFGARSGLMPNEISGGTLPTLTAKNILNALQLEMKSFTQPNNIVSLDIDRIEYEKNHKVILSNSLMPKRDTISCLFNKNNIPKERAAKRIPSYILNMDKLYLKNLYAA